MSTEHVIKKAAELLADCTRTPGPVPAAEAATAECFKCSLPATARVSMRMDGVELAWFYVCAEHRDDDAEVQVSPW